MKSLFKSLLVVVVSSFFLFFSCEKDAEPQKGTIILIPHNNPDEVHIFGGPNFDQTHTEAPEILGGAGTYYGEPTTIRALLKFGMDTLPQNAEIKSAKLTLYSNPTPLNGQNGQANSGTDNSLLIQRVTSAWVASEVKWAQQPSVTTQNQIIVPHTNVSFEDIVDLDVTQIAKDMQQNVNYGILIRLQHEDPYNFRIFCSSKNEDTSKHPKLEIEYEIK
jgi:hypothetical protein